MALPDASAAWRADMVDWLAGVAVPTAADFAALGPAWADGLGVAVDERPLIELGSREWWRGFVALREFLAAESGRPPAERRACPPALRHWARCQAAAYAAGVGLAEVQRAALRSLPNWPN